jgi:hypothetical protein
VDIQFAMSDYKYMEDLVKVKNISNEIEKIQLREKGAVDEQEKEVYDNKKKELYLKLY